MIKWLTRCIPALSALCLIILLIFAFGTSGSPQQLSLARVLPREEKYSSQYEVNTDQATPGLRLSQKILIFYTLLVHTDTALFALRLLFSILVVNKGLKATLLRRDDLPSGFYSEGVLQRTDSQELVARSPQGSPKLESKTVKFSQPSSDNEVIHTIILPNYKEDIDTLRLTLAVLAAHPRAASQYKVSSFGVTSVNPII
jgi:hypothetical protein